MKLFEPLEPSDGPSVHGTAGALAPGTMLEDFEIVRVIAEGGHSVLYLAHHVIEADPVVIKEYLPRELAAREADGSIHLSSPSGEPAFRRGLNSFVAESLALSQFDHPHLLHVSRVWEANGTAYRTMPHLAGGTLSSYRAELGKPMEQSQLKAIRYGLLDALEALHAAGLTHGHVNPDHILWVNGERPVLMDFSAVDEALSRPLGSVPQADAFSDPALTRQRIGFDLRCAAAVLHFALSGRWVSPHTQPEHRFEPLADVLLRFKDSASALGYEPEFIAAIDSALDRPMGEGLGSVGELQALFDPKPADLAPPPTVQPIVVKPRPNPMRAAPAPVPTKPPQLNASENVLNLLAQFSPNQDTAEEVEQFQAPVVPTLTEEAEPALPPIRTNLFDAIEAGDELPKDGVAFRSAMPTPSAHSPRPRPSRWQRFLPAMKFAAFVVLCVGALGWLLTT